MKIGTTASRTAISVNWWRTVLLLGSTRLFEPDPRGSGTAELRVGLQERDTDAEGLATALFDVADRYAPGASFDRVLTASAGLNTYGLIVTGYAPHGTEANEARLVAIAPPSGT
jgi:hypothetical protein